MAAILPQAPVDVSSSGSADHSASGDISGVSSVSSAGGDASGSGHDVIFSGDPTILSGDQSASGSPQEAEGGSAVFTSGEPVSASGSGSGEGLDGLHSGFTISGSGFTSGSGELSGGSRDTIIIMVDGKMVEVAKLPTTTEQELGQGGVDTSGAFLETSVSGSGDVSGSGVIYRSADVSGSGIMSASGMSALGSAEFSGISFVDPSAVDLTVEPPGEQEVSGYRPFGSGLHSGFPSGLPSGASGSGSASGDHSQNRGNVIYLTDSDMTEVTVPSLTRQPEHGRGVVEVSGQGSGSGIHHDFSSTLDQSLHLSGSGGQVQTTAEELSVALLPEVHSKYDDTLGQSEVVEESQEAEPSEYGVTPDMAYTNPTTVPSVLLESPAVMEQPEVVESK